MDREFYVHAAFAERVVKFSYFVLGLRYGHAVAGNDNHFAGGAEDRCGFFSGGAAHGASLLRGGAGDLLLSKSAEEHVAERAIHGFRHVHRENEAGGAVERAGDDEQLAIENETHGSGGKSGVGIEQRNYRGHVGAADGDDHQHAEDEGNYEHQRKQMNVAGIVNEVCGDADRDCEQQKIDEILTFICDWALREDFLQLPGSHQDPGERQRAENYFHRKHGHHEGRHVGSAQVKFRGSDERDAERAESVTERGSLRHGGHVDHAERHADDRA